MKRIISSLSIIALVLAFSGNALAQDVTASAQIVTSIDYTVDNADLYFGQLSNSFGANVILDPRGTDTQNLGAGASDANDYGQITVNGDPNVDFTLDIANPANLGNGTDSITFTAHHYGENGDTDPTNGGTASLSSTQTLTTNGSGKYYIYLGGELTSPGTAISAGNYTGDINITVSYL